MKKMRKRILFILVFTALYTVAGAQGLNSFKLPNGLTVFVWEDEHAAEVAGMLLVNVGSKDEPEEYTGLAHYLEHVMFKGTDKIGALNWEKEKPLYEQIIAKYDEMATLTDPKQKETINKEINQLTVEASQYGLSNEFSNLIQSIGGKNVNASTGYDQTMYYNSFPPGEIYKWMELYSQRLLNPVFRAFQPELETVYEEFNRGQDQQGNRMREFIFETIFSGHPYGRSIIGLPEHLKNPRLSEMVRFYNTWYVPENMALILVGNIKTREIVPLVRQTFGQLENRPVPERKQYTPTPMKGRKQFSAKIAQRPQLYLAFPGIPSSSEDDIVLDICTSILSNSSRTGLIDKLMLDGDIMGGSASTLSLKEAGRILVTAIPYYDANQRRYESLRSLERTLFKEIEKLQKGQFDDALLHSIKSELIRSYDLQMEFDFASNGLNSRAGIIADVFVNGKDIADLMTYKEKVMSITTEEIKAAAKRYFGDDFYALHLEEGKPSKGEELKKPAFDPIQPVPGAESDYAKSFQLLPVKYSAGNFADMNSVQTRPINDLSKFFYTPNIENEIFTLTLRYGIGTAKMPKLALAASLMNNAGIMGQMTSQEVKQVFSELGTNCYYSVSDSYLYVTMYGFETNLQESCNLLTRQILLPLLDEKQLNNQVGALYQTRRIEKTSSEMMSSALHEYMLYGEKSSYIDRLPMSEILGLSVSNLTGEFQRATDYEAEIHYVGSLPVDDVYNILSANLPLKQGEKASSSPEIKDRVKYSENTVFFLPDNDAKQSSIYFFIEGDAYDKSFDPYVNAFNQYFSGGFNGLVIQEIREYRSMAYTAGGYYLTPGIDGKPCRFYGSIGTQADKTLEAIDVYLGLLNNMPLYPERIGNLKTYLRETALVDRPTFRDASQTFQAWRRRGYEDAPAKVNLPAYETLSFDDIVKFYEIHIKDRPVTIAISGNPKMIDLKALEKYGKVTRLNTSRIFSDK